MTTARDVLGSILASSVAIQSFACSGADKDPSATAPPANVSQAATPARQEPANQRGLATYVQRYSNGYSLIRYSGDSVKDFPGQPEYAVVLLDNSGNPVYALGPEQQSLEFYKVAKVRSGELIYAIPLGAMPTRVFRGPFRPEAGFENRISNTRDVEGIDVAFLNPTARQKAEWFEEMPNLASLMLGR
jgi:hypothetical protein